MQVFKAKIDRWIPMTTMAIILACTAPIVYMTLMEKDSAANITRWTTTLFMLVVAAGCAHIYLTTRYVIDGDALIIRSSIWYRKTVSIATIRKVKPTRTPISAPAPSLDRLEIYYHRFDSVIISPQDKDAFVKELLKINPSIEVA